MRTALARQMILAGASGLLYPLCFPDFDLGFIAWFFLIPLHLALHEAGGRRSFLLGWLTGVVGFVGIMGWVVTAMHEFGRVPALPSYGLMLLLSMYLGAYVGLYALAWSWLQRGLPTWAFVAAPCVWVALELIRTYLFSGLPWSLLGYSQYRWLPAIQFADVTGVYGVSFLLVLVNIALAETGCWANAAFRSGRKSSAPRTSLAVAALCLLLALGYGYLQLSVATGNGQIERKVKIGVVQANIDQGRKWDPAFLQETLRRYGQLTAEASVGTDLVLWPEAATPFIFERELNYRAGIEALVSSMGAPLLLGSPALRYYPDGRPFLLNSAYLLDKNGTVSGRYDKQHLVPFGEYVPLRNSLLFFVDKLAVGIGDFESGPGPTLFELTPKTDGAPIPFGVVICYEVIFPNLVREVAAAGAELMVTITNDAWFGDSVAPFQHFGMVVLRAVENRIAFARAANTGVSGFIDPQGRILLETPIFRSLAATGELPVVRNRTFYTQYGDVFAYSCVIIAGILLATAYWRTRQGYAG